MSVPTNMTQEPLDGDTIEASRVREARDQVNPYRWVAGLDRSVSGTSLTILASPAWTVVAAGNLWKRADTEANHAETLTDDDTNYVFFAGSNGNIEVNTTGTPTDPDSVPLYRITLVGGSVTENVDLRTTTFVFPDAGTFEGLVTGEGGFDANNQKIVNLAAGTAPSDGVRFDQLPAAGEVERIAGEATEPRSEGTIGWIQQTTGVAAESSPRGVTIPSSTTASHIRGYFNVGATATTNPVTDSTVWTDGDLLEWYGFITVTGFANLNANQYAGIVFSDAQTYLFDNSAATGFAGIGVDSTGTVYVIRANGSTFTATTTGTTVTSGTPFKAYIAFTKHATTPDLTVAINDDATPTSVSTNLPDHVHTALFGKGTSTSGVTHRCSHAHAWGFTPA